jgi:hypothetical protein
MLKILFLLLIINYCCAFIKNKPLTKTQLRGMHEKELEKQKEDMIQEGIDVLYDLILDKAKLGLTELTVEDCNITDYNDLKKIAFSYIKILFPDCEISTMIENNCKIYLMKW